MTNLHTIAKFVRNDNPQSSHPLITKTFGKYGVLDRSSVATMERKPQANEFWICEVLLETRAGTPKGLFVLKPLRRIPKRDGEQDIMYLVAGFYETEKRDNVVLVRPKKSADQGNWICSNSMRRHLMRRYTTGDVYGVNAVMVVYGGEDWPKQTAPE